MIAAAAPDPTKGLSPLLPTLPEVSIEGTVYPLRRLNIRDTFSLIRLVKEVFTWGYRDGSGRLEALIQSAGTFMSAVAKSKGEQPSDPRLNSQAVGMMLAPLMGLPMLEEEICTWLGSTMKHPGEERTLSLDEFRALPMGSEVAILEALAMHPDLHAFFSQRERAMENPMVAQMAARLKKEDPKPKPDTSDSE